MKHSIRIGSLWLACGCLLVAGWVACAPASEPAPQDASPSVATCIAKPCTCDDGRNGVQACNEGGQCSSCVCPPRPNEPSLDAGTNTEPAATPEPAAEPIPDPVPDVAPIETRPEPEPKGAFPTSWVGLWKGPLAIYSAGQLRQTIGMELEIRPLAAGKTTWAITYIDKGQRQVRSYIMETINAAQGHYRIDERNSILLDSFLFDNLLISRYNISGNLLGLGYRKEKDHILFEGRMSRLNATKTTGGVGNIPPVGVYFPTTYQRAVLRRQL